jgi:hypothetical protein
VWTVTSDGRAAKNEVELGLKSVERTEIVRGVRAGDTVILTPAADLSPGQHVRTSRIDPSVAAGLNKKPDAAEGASFKGFN